MEIWYKIVDLILPFAWSELFFMKNALLAVLLITPLFGLLGTLVVNNKMAFFADALGHSALTGIAIGVILGMNNPLWAMLIFSILLSVAVIVVKNTKTASTDTIIGVFSSTAVALGIVILSRSGGFNKYSRYLIGDLLSITPGEILTLVFLVVGVLIFWLFFFNKLVIISINPSIAISKHIKIKMLETSFTIIMAIIVTVSIQWVGLLIISSLLILPAAAARNLSANLRQYHFWSILVALFSGLSGLIVSFYLNTATGATIVLIASFCYLLSFMLKIKNS